MFSQTGAAAAPASAARPRAASHRPAPGGATPAATPARAQPWCVTIGCVTLGGCLVGGMAMAQVLPQTGSGAEVSVQPRVAVPPSTVSNPIWTVTPAIEVEEQWTDNAASGQSGKVQSSFISVLSPSLLVNADSARVTGTLNYAPRGYYYTSVTSQSRIDQNFAGYGHVTLMPEQLFVDLRAFGSVSALSGLAAPTQTVTLPRQNAVQNYSFAVTPYAVHHFGGWGTLQVGVALSNTIQQSQSGAALPGARSGNQSLRSVQETAEFTTGENFGRWSNDIQVSLGQEDGTGPLAGARRDIATWQAGYAITRTITALASIGYENIRYNATGGGSGYRVSGATWAVGAKLLPNPDSMITVLYGRQDGATSLSLNASYAPTARTQLFARYSTGVSTAAEDLQNGLAGAQLDPLGNPIDSITHAPLQLTNNFFAASGAVFLEHNLSLTAAWQLERDSLQFTVSRVERTPVVAQPAGSVDAASIGTYGSIAWQRSLSEALAVNSFIQYGVSESGGGALASTTNLVVGAASLSYALSQTVTGTFEYSFQHTGASSGGLVRTPAQSTNLFVFGLRKTF